MGPFSIMNYGSMSTLTDADPHDLTALDRLAWTGQLTTSAAPRSGLSVPVPRSPISAC